MRMYNLVETKYTEEKVNAENTLTTTTFSA